MKHAMGIATAKPFETVSMSWRAVAGRSGGVADEPASLCHPMRGVTDCLHWR